MRPGRNDPCRCGSGKKYKKCHLVSDEQDAQAKGQPSQMRPGKKGRSNQRPIPPEILAAFERQTRAERERQATFGDVRQIIHTDFQGYKIVAVGSTIYWSNKWRTFVDFLFYYIVKVLGADWGNAESAKAYSDRHVILQWYQHVQEFRQRHRAGANGLKTGNPDGPTRAYLALAYDLYIVGDSLLLQGKLVKRLRHKDQFQGARYELAVAATMIRAGFELTLEDEGDVTVKHPEFQATHKRTLETFAVEAKSRHRKGVLGRDGKPLSREAFRVGITDLLRKAITKRGKLPYIIFIDANMPPEIAWQEQDTWLGEVSQTIVSVGHGYSALGVFEGGPFNALILTNWPDHYGAPGDPLPAGIGYISEALNPAVIVTDPTVYQDIERAVKQYGIIPTDFPVSTINAPAV
jgi:hypothetical protein